MAGLEGKTALVTGAGRGLGRQHGLTLAQRGASLIVHDIGADGAEETAGMIRAVGGEARVAVCDITDVAAIKDTFGMLGTVDIVVNNAGTHEARAIEAISAAEFKHMMDVHVKGAFFTVQTLLPGMKERRGGKIINTASAWGQCGWHTDSHYCGAKAAILGLTKAWAKEFAPWGIRVNAVSPGVVMTEMTRLNRTDEEIRDLAEKHIPVGRLGLPEDISYAVAYLASSEADFITGQVLPVNGGEFIVGI